MLINKYLNRILMDNIYGIFSSLLDFENYLKLKNENLI